MKRDQYPLDIVVCRVEKKAERTDGRTNRQADGAGHDNIFRPEWAEGKNDNAM